MFDLEVNKYFLTENQNIIEITKKYDPEHDEDVWLWLSNFDDGSGAELFYAIDGTTSSLDADEDGYCLLKEISKNEYPEYFL